MPEVRAAIEDLIRRHSGCTELPPPDADLLDAINIDGDDVSDLMEAFAVRFDVDLSGYRWFYHHGPDGLPFFGLSWGKAFEARRIPITIALLEQAAALGRWPVDYPGLPATEAENRSWARWQIAIGVGCPLALVAIITLLKWRAP